MRRLLERLLVLSFVVLLASCIDGHEEYWLNRNGSGAAEATYDIPASAVDLGGGEEELRRGLDNWFAGTPAVRREAFELTRTGDRVRIHLRVAFDSALDLLDLSKPEKTRSMPSSFSHLAGVFDFRLKGREFELTRTVSPAKALMGGLFLSRRETESRKLVYIVHLPEAPLESNATRTEDGGKTLVWDYTLQESLRQPLVTRFKAKIPIPVWATAGAGVLIAALGWGAWRFMRRRNARL